MNLQVIRKAQPIWQELPTNVKIIVVEELDWRSRLHLEQCSKEENYLVKISPFHLKFVVITKHEQLGISVTIDGRFKDKTFEIAAGVEFFSKVMEHPRSEAKGMFAASSFRGLLEQLQKSPETKYTLPEMMFFSPPSDSEENTEHWPVLKELFEKFLFSKNIIFIANFPTRFYRRLANSENWKNLEKLTIDFAQMEFTVDEIAHIDSIKFSSANWTSSDARKLIQVFQNKVLKPNGEVSFSIEHAFTINPIETIYEHNEELKKRIFPHRDPEARVQLFPVHTDKSVLLCVFCDNDTFKGVLCPADKYSSEFRHFADPFAVWKSGEELRNQKTSKWERFKKFVCGCVGSPDVSQ